MFAMLSLKSFCLLLMFGVTLTLAGASSAQSTTPTTTQLTTAAATSGAVIDWGTGLTTDVSIGLLQKILSDWKSSTPDPTVGALFKNLNLCVIIFASVMFVYVVVVGTMHSAHDGELLGKQWGSPFTPLRMLAGISTLFPMANGFSVIQIIVLWLATSGIGAANWVVNQTMTSFANNQGTVLTGQLIDTQALTRMMTGILLAETCVSERNFELTDPNNPGTPLYGGPFIDQGDGANSYGKVWWGPVALSTPGASVPALVADVPATACGSIEIPNFNSSVFGLAGNGTGTVASIQSTTQAFLATSFTGQDLNLANTNLHKAHFAAILAADASLKPAAQKFVSTAATALSGTGSATQVAQSATTLAAQVGIAALTYQNTIANVMNVPGALPSTSDMKNIMVKGIQTSGWATLGEFYYQYARIESELARMTGYAPKFSMNEQSEGTKMALLAVRAALAQSAKNPATVPEIADAAGHFTAGSAQGGVVGGAVAASNVVANNTAKYFGTLFGVDPNNSVDSLIQLKNVGDNIITAAEVIYIGKKAVEAATVVAAPETEAVGAVTSVASGGGGGLTGFIGKLAGGIGDDAAGAMHYVFLFAAFALIGFAMMLAFYLPTAPFVLWIGGVASWLIAVLEMTVAAPLWAAAHIHPAGEGAKSQYGANGYMLLVEVFARPMLMVCGFFVAARFTDPFLKFISSLFFNNMATVNADSLSGIVTTIAFCMLYMSICVSLINRCFSLINVLPNSVLRWVGSHGDKFSGVADIASQLEGTIQGHFSAAQIPFQQGGKAKVAKDIVRSEGSAGAKKAGNPSTSGAAKE